MRVSVLCAALISATAAQAQVKPDIILVTIDDARMDVMKDGLPRTIDYIGREGVIFENYYVTSPLCAPSRASVLRGQYAHNTGVYSVVPPEPGAGHAAMLPLENETMATVLKGAGYATALFGKYMNGFPAGGTLYRPPGWDRFLVKVRGGTTVQGAYDPMNNYVLWNGKAFVAVGNARPIQQSTRPGRQPTAQPTYETDRLGWYMQQTIRLNPPQPLFLYVSPGSVHFPFIPAERHLRADVPHPRWSPSYNEADVSDKSTWTRSLMKPMVAETHRQMSIQQRRQRQMMLAVDDLVMGAVAALRETGRLKNAYVIVVSDNGFLAGEHRLAGGKSLPYDEATRMPLLIAGPGLAKGAVRNDLIGNIDLLPTVAEMASAATPAFVDGRSFLAAAKGGPSLARNHIGIEMLSGASLTGIGWFRGFSTIAGDYAEMSQTGEHEAYDRTVDPFQMNNIWPALQPSVRQAILDRNAAISACAGQSCRDAENAPLTPITK